MKEEWIREPETVYSGRVLSVCAGEVRLEDGTVAQREVVRHSGSVAIVPVLDDAVVLVRQFRITIEREIDELAAGRIDEGETPEQAARRELEEELGYVAERMVPGSSYYSSVGFLDEVLHIFLAFGLKQTQARPEDDERIARVFVPLEEVRETLAANVLDDSKTIIGLWDLVSYLDHAGREEGGS